MMTYTCDICKRIIEKRECIIRLDVALPPSYIGSKNKSIDLCDMCFKEVLKFISNNEMTEFNPYEKKEGDNLNDQQKTL